VTSTVRSGRRSPVLVAGPSESVVVSGIAAVLAQRRGEPVGASVRELALADDSDLDLVEQLQDAEAVVFISRDPAEDLRSVRAREHVVTESSQALLTAVEKSTVQRLVVITSAALYGPHALNPIPMAEDHVPPEPPPAGLFATLQHVEASAAVVQRRRGDLRLTVLRPAALVADGIDGDVTRHFAAPRLLGIRDVSMAWQFCHVDDLGSAVDLALAGGLDEASADAVVSPVAVGAPGWLDDAEVARVTGKRRIDLPPSLVFGTVDTLQRLGATVSGSVQALVYPWVVDAARLRAAGWAASYDNEAALEALVVAGRQAVHDVVRRRRREAAGAAGATVAALGTALVVRQARRRRSG
jgi:nucleoside-diphosphate-sugar epimerase